MNGENDAKSKRQIHAWLYEDHKFLLELTRPHINGIMAYAITRTKNRLLAEQNAKQAPQINVDGLSSTGNTSEATAKAPKEADFGETILRSFVSEKAAKFGHEGSSAPIRRKAASQKHVDTMHMLAAASKKKSPPTDQ